MWPEPAARSARHVLRRICSACSRKPRSSASLLLTVPASQSALGSRLALSFPTERESSGAAFIAPPHDFSKAALALGLPP